MFNTVNMFFFSLFFLDVPFNEQQIISNKNCVEILSCALIKDLTAFKIPDNDDNWCILVIATLQLAL